MSQELENATMICSFCNEEAIPALTVDYPKTGKVRHCLQCFEEFEMGKAE